MDDSKLDLSVIICCYNSSRRITPTLEHLSKQITNGVLKWEVVVVDNNSNDGTSELATRIWSELGSEINLKVVSESNPGLSNARKKGIGSSDGELLIFCDDDNWFDAHYVQLAYDIMKADTSIGMLGGLGEEVIEGNRPVWFDKIKLLYAVGPQSKEDGDITSEKGYVYGAGAVVRKSALEAIYTKGFESQLSDRVGKTLVSGGDNEIGYMIALSGYKIFYSSKLQFQHYLPQNRLTASYVYSLVKGHQLTLYKIRTYENEVLNKKLNFPKNRFFGLFSSLKQSIRLLLALLKNKITFFDFRLSFTGLFYKQLYLITNFNTFKQEIVNVEKNIKIFRA